MKPKLIPIEKAPAYLGRDKKRFKKNIEPLLTKIILAKRAVFVDREELDTISITLK
jgi:hypothetical protein